MNVQMFFFSPVKADKIKTLLHVPNAMINACTLKIEVSVKCIPLFKLRARETDLDNHNMIRIK